MIDDELEAINGLDTALNQYEEQIESLREQWTETYEQKQAYVIDALQTLQADLDDGETVHLIDTEEFGRGGHFQYEEHLTPDGVIVDTVERVHRTRDERDAMTADHLYLWRSDDEPLAIEDEYLQTRDRNNPGFYDKLVDRFEALQQEDNHIPELHTSYD